MKMTCKVFIFSKRENAFLSAAQLVHAGLYTAVTGPNSLVEVRHNEQPMSNLAGSWLVLASDDPIELQN
jgi:hypothetical protein